MRRGVAMVVAVGLLVVACADHGPDPCTVLAGDLPALHDPGAGGAWRAIASALDGDAADAAFSLAAVADQVAALGPDASLEDRAAVALRPAVADHLATVVDYRSDACGS